MTFPIPISRSSPQNLLLPEIERPIWVRLLHWLIAFSVLVLIFSGWAIYNASPIFPGLRIPKDLTLGGWLGGAIQWHLAAMWLLVVSTTAYLMLNIVTLRLVRQFLPLSPRSFLLDAAAAMTGKLNHAIVGTYNSVQKAAYLSVFLALLVVILSGLAIWKPIQLPLLSNAMGGFDTARVVHFFAMAFLFVFFIVHMVMVAVVPHTLIGMLTLRRNRK